MAGTARYLLALAGLALASPLAGQDVELINVRSLRCSFPEYASADWQEDRPRITVDDDQDMVFHLDNIDHEANTARMIGGVGAGDLRVLAGASGISFLEVTPNGSTNLTVVYYSRNESGHFKAVHSRHTVIFGDPLPSQSFGYCQVWL